jgi:NADH dehydrogenase
VAVFPREFDGDFIWDKLRLKGFLAWPVWGVAHVYLLVGFQNRMLVSLRWLRAYLTFQRGARIIADDVAPEQASSASKPSATVARELAG